MAFLETHFSTSNLGFSKLELVDFTQTHQPVLKKRSPLRQELARFFSRLSGLELFAASLAYGLGISSRDCKRIRWQDIDFIGGRVFFNSSNAEQHELKIPELILQIAKEQHFASGSPLRGKVFGDRRAWLEMRRQLEAHFQELSFPYVTVWGALRKWGRKHISGMIGVTSAIDLLNRGPMVVRRMSGTNNKQYYLWSVKENVFRKGHQLPVKSKGRRRGSRI